MSRSPCAVSLCLAIAACGGDDDDTPPDAVASITLGVKVPDVLDLGAPLHVAWTVDGATTAPARLLLRLRAPGPLPVTSSKAGYLNTGAAPPNGDFRWIAADGSLSPDPVAASEPAVSGAIDVALPAAAGDWAVDALIVEGERVIHAYAHGTTWVAPPGPSARLELSHTFAAPDSQVLAAVRLHGTAAEPLRLSAWLTLPDDRVLSLPNQTTEYLPALEGTLEPARLQLLASELGLDYGEGRYAVSLKLETLDGITRATAGGIIRVCGAPGMLTGTVLDDAGARLVSGDIVAYGPDRTRVQGEVDANGAFALPVPAGLYVLVATGDGWSAASRGIEVDCGGGEAVELRGKAVSGKPRPHRKTIQHAVAPTQRLRALVRTNVTDVFPAEERVQFTTPTRYIPESEPLNFKNVLSVRNGRQLTFATNQPVIWSTTAGTIVQGLFTAPQEGGVVHITATTMSVAPQSKRINIVVDCSIQELAGSFGGTIATTLGTPPGIFDCPGGMSFNVIPFMVDGFEADLQYGCPALTTASYIDHGGQGCDAIFETGDFVSCFPSLSVKLVPDLSTPGNNSRKVDLLSAHGNFPPNGQCIVDYRGSGVVTRAP